MAGCLLLSMTACSSDKKNTKSASEQTTADTSTSTTSPQEYSKTDFVMSTVLSEKIYGTKDVTQDIKEELDKLEGKDYFDVLFGLMKYSLLTSSFFKKDFLEWSHLESKIYETMKQNPNQLAARQDLTPKTMSSD